MLTQHWTQGQPKWRLSNTQILCLRHISLLGTRKTEQHSSILKGHFKQWNHQKHKNVKKVATDTRKSICFLHSSWNKTVLLSHLSRAHAHPATQIFPLCTWANHHKSTMRIDFRVTNKCYQAGGFTSTESMNHVDRLEISKQGSSKDTNLRGFH